MSDLGQTFEEVIKRTVHDVLSGRDLPDSEYVATDNLGEIVEKLAIIHIRMWMLEDAIQAATTDKVKRPKYVQAINKLVDDAIIYNKSLREDSVKLYKGIDTSA